MQASCGGGGYGGTGMREAVSVPVSRVDLRERWGAERDGGIRGRLQFRSGEKRAGAGKSGHVGEFCFRQPGWARRTAAGISWEGCGAGGAAATREEIEILRPPGLHAELQL